jgi:hypothetical protein
MPKKLGAGRREIIVESDRRNVVRQFWAPPGGSEFLAIPHG